MNTGFILLHRQITEWEWYQNPNTFRVFLHILLKANFTDGRFEGREVRRGQLVTSLPKLSVQTKLTIQQVRTALKHLISTGEITDEGTSQYRIITVVKYDEYQNVNRQDNSQSTDEQQTSNRRATDEQQQYNNNNKGIREKGNNHLHEGLMDDADAKAIQQDHDRVLNAAEDAGFKMSNDVRASLIAFYATYGLEKVLDGFKACVKHSAVNLAYLEAVLKGKPKEVKPRVIAQDFDQRDYSGVQEEIMKQQAEKIRAFLAKKEVG